MKPLYIPRHASYQQTRPFGQPFQVTNTKPPFDSKWIENRHIGVVKKSFKVPLKIGDHVTPTDYGRLTFHVLGTGTAFQNYLNGGYQGVRPYEFSFGPEAAATNYWSDTLSGSGVRLTSNINHENRLMSELMKKFVDSPIRLDSTLAEVDRTANYLTHQVNNLAGGLIAVHTGSRRRGKKLLDSARRTCKKLMKSDNPSKVALAKRWFKRIPSTWKSSGGAAKRYLEYKFAILPIAYDVAGLSELMSDGLNPDPRYVHEIGVLSASHAVKIVSQQTIGTASNRSVISAEQVWYSRVYATITDPELYAASRLGVVNIAGAMWERLSYSWLADYVLPIGTFLQALTSRLGLSFVRGYKGLSLKATVNTYMKFASKPEGGPARQVVFGFQRDKLTGFPTILPYVKSPFTLKESQFFNVVALARILMR